MKTEVKRSIDIQNQAEATGYKYFMTFDGRKKLRNNGFDSMRPVQILRYCLMALTTKNDGKLVGSGYIKSECLSQASVRMSLSDNMPL
jgi:hypothetical protein